MPYWDIVTRSFMIPWKHKYLWLIAFFSGEAGAGFNFNSNYSLSRPSAGARQGQPDFGAAGNQLTTWFQNNLGLILIVIVLWLVLVVGFFILSAACEAATVRASAEHDAERSFALRTAWQAGLERMWVIVRFRLLLVLLGLPVVLVIGALIFATVLAALAHQVGAAIAFGALALLAAVMAIPYLIYLSFLDRFGSRAAVLELLAARASLGRAHHLLFKRLGRALLVWLLAIAVAIVVGIALGIAGVLVFLPLAVLAYTAASGAASWLWVVLGATVVVPVALVVAAFFAAQTSTYWTLAFRRMDVEYPRAYAYPPQPAPTQ